MSASTYASRLVDEAIHTALSELPEGTHPDDLLDCVCGQVGFAIFDEVGEVEIARRIKARS